MNDPLYRAAQPYVRRVKQKVRKEAVKQGVKRGLPLAWQFVKAAAPHALQAVKTAAIRVAPRAIPGLGAAITAAEVGYYAGRAINRAVKRRRFTGVKEEPPAKRPNTDWTGPRIPIPFEPMPGGRPRHPAAKFGRPYGVRSETKLRRFGVIRRKRSRLRRRPTRKRVFARRVKKVLDSICEDKWKDAPLPTATAQSYNGATKRYEFHLNTPNVGVLKLCLPDHLPARPTTLDGSAATAVGDIHAPETFVGKSLQLTGYTITGVMQLSAAARSSCEVRLHLLSINNKRFQASDAADSVNGRRTNCGSNWLDEGTRSFGSGQLLSSEKPVPNNPVTPTTPSACYFFDSSRGDRYLDVAGFRVGIFKHGYKLHPGFKILKTIHMDGHDREGKDQLSPIVVPFKFFIPVKKHFKDLQLNKSDCIDEMMARMPRLYILTEIVAIGGATSYPDSADLSGDCLVAFNTPRLHFKDHS